MGPKMMFGFFWSIYKNFGMQKDAKLVFQA
jgi:hypothetical protein